MSESTGPVHEHLIEELLATASPGGWEILPLETRSAGRAILAGAWASVLAGVATAGEDGDPVLALDAIPSRKGGVLLPPFRRRLHPDDALAGAVRLATASHRTDSAILTTAASTAALAASIAAAETDAPNSSALLATVVATELTARLGLAALLAPDLAFQSIHLHAVAAAVADCIVRQAPLEATAHAVRIALGMPLRVTRAAIRIPEIRGLASATAARTGLEASRMARRGVAGAPDALVGRGGLFDSLGCTPFAPAFHGVGKTWLVETFAIRSRPGSVFTEAATLAAEEANDAFHDTHGRSPSPDDIAELRILANPATVLLDRWLFSASERPFERSDDVPRSIRHMVAMALSHGQLDATHLNRVLLDEQMETIDAIASRTELSIDPRQARRQATALLAEARLPALALAAGPAAITQALKPFGAAAMLSDKERGLVQGLLTSSLLFASRRVWKLPGIRRVVGMASIIAFVAELGRRQFGHHVPLAPLKLHEMDWALGTQLAVKWADGQEQTFAVDSLPGAPPHPIGHRLRVASDVLRREASRYLDPADVDRLVPQLLTASEDSKPWSRSWHLLFRSMDAAPRLIE